MDQNINQPNKKGSGNKAVTGVIIAVLIIGGIWGLSKSFSKKTDDEANLKSTASEATESTAKEKAVKVIIDYGDSQRTETTLEAKEGLNAFAALEEAAKNDGVEVASTKYDFGVMVNSVGAYKGGDDGRYWLYYVNSKTPEVGADQYKLQAGDSVEWKFEKQ